MNTDVVRTDGTSTWAGQAVAVMIRTAVLVVAGLMIGGCSGASDSANGQTEPVTPSTEVGATEPAPDAVQTTQSASDLPAGGEVEEQEFEPLFYGDFDEEIVLYAGATTEDYCNNEPQPTVPVRVTRGDDGSMVIQIDDLTVPLYLYSSPLGAPELIEETCLALSDDDPNTAVVEPYATGEGQMEVAVEIAPDGTQHVVNSAVGTATSSDGTTWEVSGWADLQIVGGMPVGDPAEFQGLTVREVGS